jgi:glycosyltransferase involved in cell wall biosynthesis
MSSKIVPRLSVVIPTLGGPPLARTIEIINKGTLVPDEILICIPEKFTERVTALADISNVKVIETTCKGQVKQRIEGFKNAKYEFVIQLDDDIYVHDACFGNLLEAITGIEEKIAVAPALVFEHNGVNCYAVKHHVNFLNTLIHGKNWFRPGNVTRTGINIGLNAFEVETRFSQADWLPGGCVIHRRQNLVTDNYYPFTGKAFYEDVMQSIVLKKSGVKLYIDKSAVCGIEPYEALPSSQFSSIIIFHKDFPYRRYIVKLQGISAIYLYWDGLYMYYLTGINIIKRAIKNILGIRNTKTSSS